MTTPTPPPKARSHPNCVDGHVCQEPSGRACIEHGCDQQAGTLWGPLWCPDHDFERLERIDKGFAQIAASFPEGTLS